MSTLYFKVRIGVNKILCFLKWSWYANHENARQHGAIGRKLFSISFYYGSRFENDLALIFLVFIFIQAEETWVDATIGCHIKQLNCRGVQGVINRLPTQQRIR